MRPSIDYKRLAHLVQMKYIIVPGSPKKQVPTILDSTKKRDLCMQNVISTTSLDTVDVGWRQNNNKKNHLNCEKSI